MHSILKSGENKRRNKALKNLEGEKALRNSKNSHCLSFRPPDLESNRIEDIQLYSHRHQL